MATSITFRGSRQQLEQLLHQIGPALAGKIPDATGLLEGLQLRLGMVALSLIRESFITKSEGGTDEAGDKWLPLAPSTIARRRLGPADRKALADKRRLAALSPAELKALRKDMRQRKALLMARGLPAKQAAGLARAQAEAGYRAQKKIQSRFAFLSTRDVLILRDTGLLLSSLSPGVTDNVLRAGPGFVALGSNLERATWMHHGVAPHVPARRLWPAPSRFPASWLRQIYAQLTPGIGSWIEAVNRQGA